MFDKWTEEEIRSYASAKVNVALAVLISSHEHLTEDTVISTLEKEIIQAGAVVGASDELIWDMIVNLRASIKIEWKS